jgi:hypothetical protein
MKIFIVIDRWYSNTDLIACFRRREEAEKFINNQTNSRNFSIIEMDVK